MGKVIVAVDADALAEVLGLRVSLGIDAKIVGVRDLDEYGIVGLVVEGQHVPAPLYGLPLYVVRLSAPLMPALTPKMMAAGVKALATFDNSRPTEERLAHVYLAMARAAQEPT